MSPRRHSSSASVTTLHVPVAPTGPPLAALLVHVPGRVIVRGFVPSQGSSEDVENAAANAVTMVMSGSFKLKDQVVATTEAWRNGGLAVRMYLARSASPSRSKHDANAAYHRGHRNHHVHPPWKESSARNSRGDDDDDDDDDVGSLLVEISVPRPLSYVESIAETVIDQTALSTNEASHMGLVALNNSLYVTLTRPNWTMASLSMSSFGHGVIQVDAPRIQAYAMMELKASGPEAIVAVASTHVQADVMEATANGAGSVYLTSRNVSVRSLKSTMAGEGVISYFDNGTCAIHDVSMLSSGQVHAGSMHCYDTTVYSVGSGHVVVDGGHSLTSTTIGVGRLSYVQTLPDNVAHVGFAPRGGIHRYHPGDDAGPLKWDLVPAPPRHEPKRVIVLGTLPSTAVDLEVLPPALSLAMDAEVLMGLALIVVAPMVLWTYMRRRYYQRIA
ncbi:hypothetical protein H257_11278 [Aphanomyces astaci]|uniref:Putative auto-transporter adhesin head GIN domain-containing protein n=1 Tax=Aphanomyces astaci TaxID=112090 RepID=W4G2M1_APHAT|nr:hypothetical protein H257_11278 [Aphanomyces astaci]ETV73962.1 hypothetical protein H257_11278 [Aphanomyces astaci]|eukprot:XP_009836475.1 hypothetical protein H257_11278 [Aphanomyces astaci]